MVFYFHFWFRSFVLQSIRLYSFLPYFHEWSRSLIFICFQPLSFEYLRLVLAKEGKNKTMKMWSFMCDGSFRQFFFYSIETMFFIESYNLLLIQKTYMLMVMRREKKLAIGVYPNKAYCYMTYNTAAFYAKSDHKFFYTHILWTMSTSRYGENENRFALVCVFDFSSVSLVHLSIFSAATIFFVISVMGWWWYSRQNRTI